MPALQKTKPVGPDEIWAILQRVSESQEETSRIVKETARQMKETDRQMKETDRKMKETDRQMKETDRQMQETDRKMKETDRKMQKTDERIKLFTDQFGELGNKFGTMTEHLVAPGVVERFNKLGYHFDGIADRGFKIIDDKFNLLTEIDILLENGDYIIAVEVKADVRKKDLEHHEKRMEILRKHRSKKNDKRKIRGAIAGAVFHANIKEMALAKGFYVLEQSGDTMKMAIPKGFKPKEW